MKFFALNKSLPVNFIFKNLQRIRLLLSENISFEHQGFFFKHQLKNNHARVRECRNEAVHVILKFSRIPGYFLAKNLHHLSVQIIICESRKKKYSRFGAEIKDIYLSLPSCLKTAK